jgi:hypothetical protein
MAVAINHAVDRERRKVGRCILDQDEAGMRGADLRNRGGNRARQVEPPGDRGLHIARPDRHEIDEISVDEERRVKQHRSRDLGLVVCKRQHDGGRRVLTRGERLRERAAHQRRRIVEQHEHRAFGGGAVVGCEVGIEIGARERARRFGPLAGGRRPDPVEELTNDHRHPRNALYPCAPAARGHDAATVLKATPAGLIKRSP